MATCSEESQDWQKFSIYCQQLRNIEKKLEKNIPEKKEENLRSQQERLTKLISELLRRIGRRMGEI